MDAETEFVAVDMPHASRFMLHIMAAVAEHERQIIGERTKAALAAAKAKGVRLGANGAVLARLNKEAASAYAQEVRGAFLNAVAAGHQSTRAIADWLNSSGLRSRQGGQWHPASVARTLRRLA